MGGTLLRPCYSELAVSLRGVGGGAEMRGPLLVCFGRLLTILQLKI